MGSTLARLYGLEYDFCSQAVFCDQLYGLECVFCSQAVFCSLNCTPESGHAEAQKMYDFSWSHPVFGHAFDMIFHTFHGRTRYVDIDSHLDL